MKHLMLLLALSAAPIAAQTSNDDMPAIENWWDKVGADFFGPATMQEPRPEHEIRAQWTGLSADDQAAVLARCTDEGSQTAAQTSATSLQEGSTDEGKAATSADLADIPPAPLAKGSDDTRDTATQATTTTGSAGGTELQTSQADNSAALDTGLAGGTGASGTNMVLICELIPNL